MDYSLLYLLGTIFVCLCVPLLIFLVGRKRHGQRYEGLPQGKLGLPVVGESLEYLSLGKQGKPEKFVWDRMQKYSREVFKTSLLKEKMVVFCGAPGNKFLFSNENKLVISWWPSTITRIFKTMEGSLQLRGVLYEFLKIEPLRKYIPVIDYMAKQHLKEKWCNKGQVLAFEELKNFTFEVVCRLFLSVEKPETVATLLKHFNCIIEGFFALPIDLPGTTLNRAIKASKTLQTWFSAIIKQRRMELTQKGEAAARDILSHMIVMTDTEGLFVDDMDIATKLVGLFVGSHESTSTTITFILKYLAENLHVYEKVFQEQQEIAKSKREGEPLNWEDIQKMRYSWNVACETMRLRPPVGGTFREAITDFTYAGFTIPKGWKIHWNAYTTHKDPKYFSNPNEFDPSRFEDGAPPFTFVPFGGGPRICPGREFARLVILIFLHNVVNKFRWEKLAPFERITCVSAPTPEEGFPICLKPHVNTIVH
ncbi:Cytochrome P450 [Dillenia turbinata]|uniref:Cytochrome P450 n=1 Tax=Dillenia turbinata TaxID=194707 RepID=A0AAN8VIN0_9MAGN